jgi:hypothetical protein
LKEQIADARDQSLLQALREDAAHWQKKRKKARLYLVLSGDYGGQIYLTVPWKLVGPKGKIASLLERMDRCRWCNERGTYIQIYSAKGKEKGIPGGMGGGELTDGLWLHFVFVDRERYPIMPGRPGHDELGKTDWKQLATELLDIQG